MQLFSNKMDETEIIKNIKLVEVKDKWMTRGIKTVDINDDCKTKKRLDFQQEDVTPAERK